MAAPGRKSPVCAMLRRGGFHLCMLPMILIIVSGLPYAAAPAAAKSLGVLDSRNDDF